MIAGYLGVTAGAAFLYYLNCRLNHLQDLERRSSVLAVYPLLLAERDREFLKQMRKNRDEEAKLMANVEGWKVGTWYGEPIYHNVAPDTWVMPKIYEYYAHASYKDYAKRANLSLWS